MVYYMFEFLNKIEDIYLMKNSESKIPSEHTL